MNSFSCIFYGKHHGSGIVWSFHFLCRYQCCVCPVPQPRESHCHLEFPPNVLQHRTFCFCLNGAETGILRKKNVSRSIFKQEMARREKGMGAERGGTKYAPGQCYCCTSYRTELSMALSVNSLTTEKTVLKTPLVRAPAPLRHSGFGTL